MGVYRKKACVAVVGAIVASSLSRATVSASCEMYCSDNLLYSDMDCSCGDNCPCGPRQWFDLQSGDCLGKAQCKARLDESCRNNQVRVACAECLPTCDDPFLPKRCLKSFDCGETHGAGCGCPSGQVLDERTQFCVKQHQCDKRCPNNLIEKTCAECQSTCIDPKLSDRCICASNSERTCGCPDGMLLDQKASKCVKPSKCTRVRNAKCIWNQIWSWASCGEKDCVASCEYPNAKSLCSSMAPVCEANAIGGCSCPDGKLLLNNKRCVKPKKCQSVMDRTCPGNQVYLPCAECQPTCKLPGDHFTCLPSLDCGITHGGGCGCPEGLLLDEATQQCVAANRCSASSSAENCPVGGVPFDDPSVCKSACPATCDPEPKPCIAVCVTKGCQCPEKMVLRESDNTCVKRKHCDVNVA
mmetsp:Transcript_24029/g.44578  ORF Transcript_24029/g.44578 Transcript_24029/m.44578 type:complete len:413 (-) Transcript_24029:292-1530(-)